MTFIITADQQVPVTVEFTDDHGNPATVDGMPVWAVTDDTILAVVAAADGMSAVASAVGPVGQAQLSVRADGDLGAGIVEVIGVLDIQVIAGNAVMAVMTAGTPVPIIWASGP